MTLTQSKPSTRRSALLLHRSHAINLSDGLCQSGKSLWFTLSQWIMSTEAKGSRSKKGRIAKSNKAILVSVENSQLISRVAGRAGVVVREKKKTNDYPTVLHMHY